MSDLAFGTHAIAGRAGVRSRSGLAKGLSGSVFRLVWLMLARSRERRVLASLDARGLRDIGLARDEAAREARKWFWQG